VPPEPGTPRIDSDTAPEGAHVTEPLPDDHDTTLSQGVPGPSGTGTKTTAGADPAAPEEPEDD
jgi:hypothetical protein